MHRNILSLLALFLLVLPVRAEVLNLNAILDATARVKAGGSYGSATCIGKTDTTFLFLTNGHVVGSNKTVTIEVFNRGLVSKPLPATVVFARFRRGTDEDIAILSVPSSYFGKYPPRVIPLAPPSFKLMKNQYIASCGCGDAEFARGWEGKVWWGNSGQLYFSTPPRGGQSGSAIVGIIDFGNGRLESRVCGVVTWRLGNSIGPILRNAKTVGGAIPSHRVYEILQGASGKSIPVSHKTALLYQPR